jgi:cbb3-type cytochrome oxidase subunit 1
MKYAVEMDSGVMIYISSFIKIGSGTHQKLMWRRFTDTQQGDLISLFLFIFFKIREVGSELSSSGLCQSTLKKKATAHIPEDTLKKSNCSLLGYDAE